MRATVPTNVVDNSYENFPEGTYVGRIDSAEVRDPNKDGSWKLIRLGLSDIEPANGTPDPGRSRFNSDITILTDGVDLFEVEDFRSSDVPFVVVRGAGLLAGLAEGLGVGTRTERGVEADLQQLANALLEGDFEGEAVSFEVSHYTNKKGDTYDQFNRFGVAG